MKNRYPFSLLVLLLLVFQCFDAQAQTNTEQFLLPSSALPTHNEVLVLASGRVIQGNNAERFPTDEAYFSKARLEDSYWLLVRFSSLPSHAERVAMQQEGIRLLAYYSKATYLAEVSGRVAASTFRKFRLSGLYPLEATDKMPLGLLRGDFPEGALQTTGKVHLVASVAASVNEEKVRYYFNQNQIQVLEYYPAFGQYKLEVTPEDISKAASLPFVTWLEAFESQELQNTIGRNGSRSHALQQLAQLRGKGARVGIWDGGIVGPHIDFSGRLTLVETASNSVVHATHVSGVTGGAGLRDPNAIGMAPEASLFIYSIADAGYIPYEMFNAIQNYQIDITQNSYGPAFSACFGAVYTGTSQSQDWLVNNYPKLLHVFAVGNSGNRCTGSYGSALRNSAKNIISVGGINADNTQLFWLPANPDRRSSSGPMADGRMHPHVTAHARDVYSTQPGHVYASAGWSGTSFSAPLVSGVAAKLYERYRQLYAGQSPEATLIKALLCNNSSDLGNPGPDYMFGFGKVNASKALKALEEARFNNNNVVQGQTRHFQIEVAPGASSLKVLLAWNDPAGTPGAPKSLVNDLNIRLIAPDNSVLLPWVLDKDNPAQVATRGVDNVNNAEQVTIDNPQAGSWRVEITGHEIAIGAQQNYFCTWTIEGEQLQLVYPIGGEQLIPGSNQNIEWDASGLTGNIKIEYFDGSNWQLISNSIPVNNLIANWTIPSVASAQLRIRLSAQGAGSGQNISSEGASFTAMPVPNMLPNTNAARPSGNNFIDLSWSTVAEAQHYDILRLNMQTSEWENIKTVDAPTTNTRLDALLNGTQYWFSVRARRSSPQVIVGQRAYAAFGTPSGVGPAQDMALIRISLDTSGICINDLVPLPFKAIIKNAGTNTLPAGTNVTVEWRTDPAAGWTAESFSLSEALAAGEEVELQLSDFMLSGAGELRIYARINSPADAIPDNNSAQFSISIPSPVNLSLRALPGTESCFPSNSEGEKRAVAQLIAEGIVSTQYKVERIDYQQENTAGVQLVNINNNTNVSEGIALGFSFPFFGQLYDKIYISSEGLVGFDAFDFTYASSVMAATPNTLLPNNYIALAWMNLSPETAGSISHMLKGTAPNQKFIITYKDVPHADVLSNRLSGQIILHEAGGLIDISIEWLSATSVSVITGIENRAGDGGIAAPGRNFTPVPSNIVQQTWRFSPVAEGFSWNDGQTALSRFVKPGYYGYSYHHRSCSSEGGITVLDVCDNEAPYIIELSPLHELRQVNTNTPLRITFNESIRPGSGNLVLKGGGSTKIFAAQGNTSDTLLVEGRLVELRLAEPLATGAIYEVEIQPAFVKDFASPANNFAGLNSWQFRTLNTAPHINNEQAYLFPDVAQDTAYVEAITVQQLIESRGLAQPISDPDFEALQGIAIIETLGNARVQYQLPGQNTWTDVAVSASSALLLTPEAQLRAIPEPAYSGLISPLLRFRAWDQSEGNAGGRANLSLPEQVGGSTAFSAQIATASVRVKSRPFIAPIPDQTGLEDEPLINIAVELSDADNLPSALVLSVSTNNTALFPTDSIRISGTGALRFLSLYPFKDSYGVATIHLFVSNGSLSSARQFMVEILPVNDPPVVNNIRLSTPNNAPLQFNAVWFRDAYSDVENDSLAFIRLEGLVTSGEFQWKGQNLEMGVSIPFEEIGELVYLPSAGFEGSLNLQWNGSDGELFAKQSAGFTIEVLPSNRAPSIVGFQKTGMENRQIIFSASDFAQAFSDPDGDQLKLVQITSVPLHGSLLVQGSTVSVGNELSPAQLALLRYSPQPDFFGSDVFEWKASDGFVYSKTAEVQLRINFQPIGQPQQLIALPGSGEVGLRWLPNPEPNIAHYEVQVLASAGIGWATVAITSETNFTVSELQNGTLYLFRIRAVSRSGIQSPFSSTVQGQPSIVLGTESSPTDAISIQLYPNPSEGMVYVSLSALLQESLQISVCDVLGRKVFSESMSGQNQILRLNLSHCASGTYILSIKGKNLTLNRHFVIHK